MNTGNASPDRRTSPNQPASPKKGIQSRLIRVFAVQAALVSIATILGVYAAYKITEGVLVKEALNSEARHYLSLVEKHGNYPLPNTSNMTGYSAPLDQLDNLPAALRALQPGFGRHDFEGKQPLILVTEQNGNRLYLIFREEQVSRLALVFGVAPLSVVLILIYLASWFTFRQSQSVVSPVVELAKVVEHTPATDHELLTQALAPFHQVDVDIAALATAIEHFASRLQLFIERERSFTRDASHELRTPLAVLKGSLDVLDQMGPVSERNEQVTKRMRDTVSEMENLIETLLLLAREEDNALPADSINLNLMLPTIANTLRGALADRNPDIRQQDLAQLSVVAPPRILTILFSNLIRNAVIHGEGSVVQVIIQSSSVAIKDQGPGMTEAQLQKAFQPFYRGTQGTPGHGLGLTIVKRLCRRFQWTLDARSEPGVGTTITVDFTPPATA